MLELDTCLYCHVRHPSAYSIHGIGFHSKLSNETAPYTILHEKAYYEVTLLCKQNAQICLL